MPTHGRCALPPSTTRGASWPPSCRAAGRGGVGAGAPVGALDAAAGGLRLAAGHEGGGFRPDERSGRGWRGSPPYAQLVRVVCSSTLRGPESLAAGDLRERIAAEAPGARLLGPAPLFRLKGRDRAQLLVKAPPDGPPRAVAVRAVRHAVEAVAGDKRHRGVTFSVDVDPQ